jgi:polysaccharide biosynthesis protein PslE
MADELTIVPRTMRAPSLTLRDVVSVMFRQRRLVVISFAVIFVGGMLYRWLAPSYQAEMKVLVRRARVDPVMTPTPTQTPLLDHEEITEEALNSEVELLHDQDTLETVVKTSGITSENESWIRELTGENPEERLAREVRSLGRKLEVEPVRKSTLITVSYASSNPVQAERVLRCLAQAYLDRHLRVHRTPGQLAFFEQQMVDARRGLEDAQSRLMEFSHDQGIVAADLERDATLQKLLETDANDRVTKVSIVETEQRIRALLSKLQVLPERTTTQVRSSDNMELLENMKAKLLDLELKRTELLAKFEPSYRLVQEIEQQISQTKTSIAAQDRAPVLQTTVDQNPDHQWAAAELIKAEVEFTGLTARAGATNSLLTSYRKTAQELGDHAIQQDELLGTLKAAEAKYLMYANKREEARIGDAMDQGGILNVAIAEQPTVPALPKWSILAFGLSSFVLAGTASTGLAFAADYLNPAFRTPDEVIAYLGSPVLASLPSRNS